jgi:hypothetical protein
MTFNVRMRGGLTPAMSGAGHGTFKCKQTRQPGIHSSAIVGP